MTQTRRLSSEALQRARLDYITEESVYGTVLVSGMIVVAGSYGATSWQVFLSVFGTVVVFWAAHVYAGTIAGHGVSEEVEGDSSLLTAFRRALRRSVGFLTSALPPSIVLLLGATQAIDDAVAIWTALWLGVIILGVLGFIVFSLRGDSWLVRILGALGTAVFGVAMIILKALIH
ncbi:hypothetical protein [Diaminobutyricibacter sp. McL0608]|uniref:hypothetical protein n=1 Tax=Leifsonia sp. McL0608 TaxID=3143537 RepID=UPI0031F32E7D